MSLVIKISAFALSVAPRAVNSAEVFSPLLERNRKARSVNIEDLSAACDCDAGSCQAVEINDGAFLSQGSISIAIGESGGVEELHFDRAVYPNGQIYSNEGGASAWLMRSKATGRLSGHLWGQDGTKYELFDCKAMKVQVLSRGSPRHEEIEQPLMMQVIEDPEFRMEVERKARTRASRSGTSYPTVRWIYSAATENAAIERYDSMEDAVDDIVCFLNMVLATSEIDMQIRTHCIEPWYDFDETLSSDDRMPATKEYLNTKYPSRKRNRDADFFHFLFHGRTGGTGLAPGRRAWSYWRLPRIIMHELGHNFGLAHNGFMTRKTTTMPDGYGNVMSYSMKENGKNRHFFTNPQVRKPWGKDGGKVRLGNRVNSGYNSGCPFQGVNYKVPREQWCSRGNDAQYVKDQRFTYEDHGTEENQCVWPCRVGTRGLLGRPNCKACNKENVLRYKVIPSLDWPRCGVAKCKAGFVTTDGKYCKPSCSNLGPCRQQCYRKRKCSKKNSNAAKNKCWKQCGKYCNNNCVRRRRSGELRTSPSASSPQPHTTGQSASVSVLKAIAKE